MVNQESHVQHGDDRGVRIEGSDAGWTDDLNGY
jgi:hypothetical protein